MSAWISLIGWIVLTFGAGFVGMRFVPGEWYEQIRKPAFTPPDAVFAPGWTGLYVLMAIAAWLIWEQRATHHVSSALLFFIVQLGLNALWSYLFFGLHRIDLALIDIVLLWLCALLTLILFWGIKPLAGALLVPYLLWVSFTNILNYAIWKLNLRM